MNREVNKNKQTHTLLMQHFQAYPLLQTEDMFKFLYQSAHGCEHLVSDEQAALHRIQNEYASMSEAVSADTDQLDGAYSRVHLGVLRKGLRPQTLTKLFCLSAQKEPDGAAQLAQKLTVAREPIGHSAISLDRTDFDQKLDAWRAQGFPAVHHSDSFRAAYHPAYRVIANQYADLLPVFTAIYKQLNKSSAIVAIEGGSASGKTTLAGILQQVYGCNVFHTDDFFLRPEQRTQHRLEEIGGNFDRERFADEVLQPLCKEEAVHYRRFDCATQTLSQPITVQKIAVTVIEGVYSLHPALGKYCDLTIFLDIDSDLQKKRIIKRNSVQMAKRFFDEWIPLENVYFEQMRKQTRFDVHLIVNRDNG